MDITYVPMKRGFLYLTAVMDWASRRILAFRISNTMHTDFCAEALNEAITRYGRPQIMNTDQGSQFTSGEFTEVLKDHGIAISMDGRGCWRDNVFIERFWRTIKYDEIYLHAYAGASEARAGVARFIAFYNALRPHQSLQGKTPDQTYFETQLAAAAA